MSHPRYPAYVPTNFPWLGEIPKEWEVQRLKILFEIVKTIAKVDGLDVLSVTQKGIRVKDTESNEGQLSMDYSKYQIVHPGDFVMNHMDLLTGYVDVSAWHGVTSPDYRVFRLRDDRNSSRYFLYLLQNCYHNRLFFPFGQGSSQLGRWRLPTEAFNQFIFPVPSPVEQTSIAAFLDRETAKIDALVEEQKRLIDLLKEKRQAVVSHAVTKGLNPHAPMKDSGIEWLGEVPEHWAVTKLGRYISILSGFAFPSSGFSLNVQDTRLLRGINVGVGETKWEEVVYWPRKAEDQLERFELRPGQIVVGMDRPWINEGVRVARISDADLPCLLLQRVTALTVGNEMSEDFVYHLLSSALFVSYFTPDMTGVSVPHLSPEQISNFIIAVPPLSEQQLIAAHIGDELKQLAALLKEAEAAIAHLQERRAALISAVVTGKIDVRSLVEEREAA